MSEEILHGRIVPTVTATRHGGRDGILLGKDKIRLRSVLMALVTVEDQSSSDLFFLCSLLNGFVHQGLGVFRTELVGNDKPIEQVFDRGEIPPALLCGDVRICPKIS